MSTDAEWLAWRAAGLGASDVAAAHTGAYRKTVMSVVAEKLGRLDTTPDAATQRDFDRGHALEPMVTTATEVLTGWHIVGEQTWCQHPEFPHHRATVDGFLSTEPEASIDDVAGLFECKTRGAGRPRHLDYYTAQVNWQMWVTGLDVALLTEATVDEAGALTEIVGPNGAGKTSFVSGILWALAGRSGQVAKPVKEGADTAEVRVLAVGEYEFEIRNVDAPLAVTVPLDGDAWTLDESGRP